MEYQFEVEDLIGGVVNRGKMFVESFQYLVLVKFFYKNLEGQVDYLLIVIQCGRVVERELLDFFRGYKNNFKVLLRIMLLCFNLFKDVIRVNLEGFVDKELLVFINGFRGG